MKKWIVRAVILLLAVLLFIGIIPFVLAAIPMVICLKKAEKGTA